MISTSPDICAISMLPKDVKRCSSNMFKHIPFIRSPSSRMFNPRKMPKNKYLQLSHPFIRRIRFSIHKKHPRNLSQQIPRLSIWPFDEHHRARPVSCLPKLLRRTIIGQQTRQALQVGPSLGFVT